MATDRRDLTKEVGVKFRRLILLPFIYFLLIMSTKVFLQQNYTYFKIMLLCVEFQGDSNDEIHDIFIPYIPTEQRVRIRS